MPTCLDGLRRRHEADEGRVEAGHQAQLREVCVVQVQQEVPVRRPLVEMLLGRRRQRCVKPEEGAEGGDGSDIEFDRPVGVTRFMLPPAPRTRPGSTQTTRKQMHRTWKVCGRTACSVCSATQQGAACRRTG